MAKAAGGRKPLVAQIASLGRLRPRRVVIATHHIIASAGLSVEKGWLPPVTPTAPEPIGALAGEPDGA